MKYYKVIKVKGFTSYKQDVIYPQTWKYSKDTSLDTEYFVNEYPERFQEVSEQEYLLQELGEQFDVKEKGVLLNSTTDLEVGDILIIKKAPSTWASLLKSNSPLNLNIYPYTCIVKEIQKDNDYTGMTCGNYGWSVNSLVLGKNTYKIIKPVKQEEVKEVKKIAYYNFIKEEYKKAAEQIMGRVLPFDNKISVDLCIKRLKEAGVLDLWCIPIYESDFNIGDIIMFDSPSYKNGPYELMSIDGDKGYDQNKDTRDLRISHYRLATEQEKADYIEARDVIKIKGYTAKIGDRVVAFGCQSYSKDFVIDLGDFLLTSGLKIEFQDEIMKVYNKFKENKKV